MKSSTMSFINYDNSYCTVVLFIFYIGKCHALQHFAKCCRKLKQLMNSNQALSLAEANWTWRNERNVTFIPLCDTVIQPLQTRLVLCNEECRLITYVLCIPAVINVAQQVDRSDIIKSTSTEKQGTTDSRWGVLSGMGDCLFCTSFYLSYSFP